MIPLNKTRMRSLPPGRMDQRKGRMEWRYCGHYLPVASLQTELVSNPDPSHRLCRRMEGRTPLPDTSSATTRIPMSGTTFKWQDQVSLKSYHGIQWLDKPCLRCRRNKWKGHQEHSPLLDIVKNKWPARAFSVIQEMLCSYCCLGDLSMP